MSDQPRCRHCGKRIVKLEDVHRWWWAHVWSGLSDCHPTTHAEPEQEET